MSKVCEIINLWGGPAELARATGKPYTTVKTWFDQQRIPYSSWATVADASKGRGFTVSTTTIFRAHEADRRQIAA